MYKTIKSMREALEEARSYRDPVNEDKGFSSQQIKMAYGVLNDPRYKQGNYSGAYKAIEKIARGLASHPDVANALKRANEELQENVNAIVSRVKSMVGSVEYDKRDRAIIVPDKDVKKVADFVKRQSGSKEIYAVIGDKENVTRTTSGKASARKIKDRFYDDKIHGKQDQVIINPSLGMREELDKDDKETIKPIIKQLQKSVKAHDKQAKQLQKDIQDEVKLESAASDKAKGMGLDYLSFGRYGKGGKVTHKNIGGTLTAVDKDEKPVKEPEDKKDDDSKMPADVMKTFNDIKNFEITDNNAEQVEKLEKARDDFDDAGKEKYAAEIDSALEELMDDEPENADDILSDLKQKIKDDFNESVSAISIKLKEAFTKADFAKLESDNEHTEAAEKLINMFGTKEEKFKMAAIKARHNMTGYIKGPDYRERIRLVNKYYSRLK